MIIRDRLNKEVVEAMGRPGSRNRRRNGCGVAARRDPGMGQNWSVSMAHPSRLFDVTPDAKVSENGLMELITPGFSMR